MSAISTKKKSLSRTRTAGSDKHKLPKTVNSTPSGEKSQESDRHSGLSLAARLERSGPLPLESVLKIFSEVAVALEKAHELGTIHGDISPSKILIWQDETDEREIVRLIDFSAVNSTGNSTGKTSSKSKSRSKKGAASRYHSSGARNALYISPEQAIGGSVDCRADIYSTGCALFQALTGKPPFEGESAQATIEMHINEAPPLLPDSVTESRAGKRMQLALAKMLHKNREMRPQSATALLNTLKDISSLLSEHKEPTEKAVENPDKHSLKAPANQPFDPTAMGEEESQTAQITTVLQSVLVTKDSGYEWAGTPADYCSKAMAAILTLMIAATVLVWITLKAGTPMTLPQVQATAVISR